MLRVTALLLATAAFVPFGPLGCPPTEVVPEEFVVTERGSLATAASAPQTAAAGETAMLQASVTPNADSGTISYAWFQTAGPGVQLVTADQATATFYAPSLQTQQTLRFMVTARDEVGAVGRAEVSVTVTAEPNYGTVTVADAGPDQAVQPGGEAVLDGSKSKGAALKYRWRQVSGPTVTLSTSNAAQARFIAPDYDPNSSNVLLFELEVTDSADRKAADRTQVGIHPRVTVETSLGSFVIELFADRAPVSVRNFWQYVDDKFYDGTIFHRVIPKFMIQGGGYLPDLTEKPGTRDPIVNEANNGLSNTRGTVAMARTSEPDSATAQFFVNVANNIKGGDGKSDLDPGGVDAAGYAVFGRVVEGMDVVDAIVKVKTGERGGMQDVPLEDIVIQSITRVSQPAGSSEGTNVEATPPSGTSGSGSEKP